MKDNKWAQFLIEGKKLAEAAIMKRNYKHQEGFSGKDFTKNEIELIRSFQRAFYDTKVSLQKLVAKWTWGSEENRHYLNVNKISYGKNKNAYISHSQYKPGAQIDEDRTAISQPFDGEEDLKLLKSFLTELKIGQ
jgi:hypothetical protein